MQLQLPQCPELQLEQPDDELAVVTPPDLDTNPNTENCRWVFEEPHCGHRTEPSKDEEISSSNALLQSVQMYS